MLVCLVNLHDHTQPIVRESCIGIMYGIRTVKIWWWLIDHSWVSGCNPDPQVLELELCVVGRIMIDQWSMTTPQLHFLPKHNSNIIPIPDHWPRGNILRRTLTQNWPAIVRSCTYTSTSFCTSSIYFVQKYEAQNGRISTFAPPSAENARVRLKVLSRIVSQLHRSEVDVAEAKIPPCHFDHWSIVDITSVSWKRYCSSSSVHRIQGINAWHGLWPTTRPWYCPRYSCCCLYHCRLEHRIRCLDGKPNVLQRLLEPFVDARVLDRWRNLHRLPVRQVSDRLPRGLSRSETQNIPR